VRISFLAKKVRVMVLKDLGNVRADGEVYELRKGTEVELPRWLARTLQQQGIVKILETPLTIDDIARVHFNVFNARSLRELEAVPEYFYLQVQEYLEELSRRIREEFNAALLDERRKAELYMLEIVSRRITALLQALRSPAAVAEISSKLSMEERVLADAMKSLLDDWLKTVVKSNTAP